MHLDISGMVSRGGQDLERFSARSSMGHRRVTFKFHRPIDAYAPIFTCVKRVDTVEHTARVLKARS